MVAVASAVLAVVFTGPLRVVADGPVPIEPEAVQRGLSVRLMEEGDGWTVVLHAHSDGVLVVATARGRARVETVVQIDRDDSRADAVVVASTVAIALEASPADHEEQEGASDAPRAVVASERAAPWWVAVSALATGNATRDVDVTGAYGLGAGRWFGSLARVGVRLEGPLGLTGTLRFQGFHPAVEVAVGGHLRRLWLGGAVSAGPVWVWAADRIRASGATTRVTLPLVAEFPLPKQWFVRGRLGIALHAPRLRVLGQSDAVVWETVRLVSGLEVGVRLP